MPAPSENPRRYPSPNEQLSNNDDDFNIAASCLHRATLGGEFLCLGSKFDFEDVYFCDKNRLWHTASRPDVKVEHFCGEELPLASGTDAAEFCSEKQPWYQLGTGVQRAENRLPAAFTGILAHGSLIKLAFSSLLPGPFIADWKNKGLQGLGLLSSPRDRLDQFSFFAFRRLCPSSGDGRCGTLSGGSLQRDRFLDLIEALKQAHQRLKVTKNNGAVGNCSGTENPAASPRALSILAKRLIAKQETL
ncbi:hypothetical protein Anapl_17495 [Anas platyrhynchos]|uniref:Uncharacterized protein n=1 Tax=Anas platyrhynchos TaxID=8839 RepID=R0KZY6_ANAPL|nr:hypothetical protein Anapl_17495 [Anas platyrhynchos]